DNGQVTSGGSGSLITSATFLRSYSGTPGTSTFQLTVSSGGAAVSGSIDPFFFTLAPVFVASGFVSSGAVVSNNTTLEVQSAGTAVASQVKSGGMIEIDLGGVGSGTAISSGGVEVIFGSETSASILGGGIQKVESGGVAVATMVLTGGEQTV